jgi:hypothetical protein
MRALSVDDRFWDFAAIDDRKSQHNNHVGPRQFSPWAACGRFCFLL